MAMTALLVLALQSNGLMRRPQALAGPVALLLRLLFMGLATAAAAAQDAAPPVPPAAADPAHATQQQIDAAIDRGVSYLLKQQELDGSWRADEHRYISGQTGLCVYTLLKAGLPTSHPAVRRGLTFIRYHPPEWTYGISCCILAMHTAGPELYRSEITHYIELLMEAHGRGFSYPGHHEDLSLTQYGCLALRAAESMGIEVSPKVWEDIVDFAFRVRDKNNGAFNYTPGNRDTGSMTSAGIAVLQIAREALDSAGRLSKREAAKIDDGIEGGIQWLAKHMVMDRNPDPDEKNHNAGHVQRWKLYYLYGLERVGGLTGRKLFGKRDWYKEASTFLVGCQGDDGSWSTSSGEKHPGTCFGVLVLKRATAPTSGAKPARSAAYGADDAAQEVSLRITGDTPLTAWVSSFGATAIETHEWDKERGKGLRVHRVEYFDPKSGTILATQPGSAEEPHNGKRFAVQIRMAKPGDYEVAARVFVRPMDGDANEEVALVSPPLKVRVDAVMTKGMSTIQEDFGKNELRKTSVKAEASSVLGQQTAAQAVDGTGAYGWACANDDSAPWIEVNPSRPQRGNTVALTPIYRGATARGDWGKPTRIALRINGKRAGEFDIDPELYGKTYVALKKRITVRTIRIEILTRQKGSRGGEENVAGFAEVELQLREADKKKR